VVDDSRVEAFHDYVADGIGNMSIPTSLGRRQKSGCSCRFPERWSKHGHASRLARGSHPWDDEGDFPYCLSTYSGTHRPSEHGNRNPETRENVQMMFEGRPCMAEVAGVTRAIDDEVKDLITTCLTPDRKSYDLPSKTMFLLGDCHSAVILPGLVLAVRGIYQIRHVYSDSVGLFPHHADQNGLHSIQHSKTNTARFVDVYQHILQVIRTRMQPGDVVVISQFTGNWNAAWNGKNGAVGRLHGKTGPVVDLEGVTPVDLMEKDLLQGIVQPKGGRLFVLGDWPYFPAVDGMHGKPSSAEAKVEAHAKLQTQLEPVLERHRSSLRYRSLIPLFCKPGLELDNNWTTAPKGACSWTIPGSSIQAFADDNHLNTVGSMYMWPYLCDLFTDGHESSEVRETAVTSGQLSHRSP
jgi:hypothetical protein